MERVELRRPWRRRASKWPRSSIDSCLKAHRAYRARFIARRLSRRPRGVARTHSAYDSCLVRRPGCYLSLVSAQPEALGP